MAISVTDISALPADRAAPAQHFAWMLRVVLDSRLPIHEFVYVVSNSTEVCV